jgi:hypothetical protein
VKRSLTDHIKATIAEQRERRREASRRSVEEFARAYAEHLRAEGYDATVDGDTVTVRRFTATVTLSTPPEPPKVSIVLDEP